MASSTISPPCWAEAQVACKLLPPADNPRIFVLRRELAGVYLLLDNISASPDSHLPGTPDPATGLGADWIEQVCEIEWPPAGSPVSQAAQAQFLIRVKDYLNTLAKPASGLTIAFTLLVNQQADPRTCGEAETASSRRQLAAEAYPDLCRRAGIFRRVLFWMRLFLLAWLIFTCVMSWYVAFGSAAIAQRAAGWTAYHEATEAIFAVDRPAGAGADAAPGKPPQPAYFTPADCSLPPKDGGPNPAKCMRLAEAREMMTNADGEIAEWLFKHRSAASTALSTYAIDLAAILATAVLPVLYGFLGAGTAMLRLLSRKVQGALLEPRDLYLALQQLALGAVTGACIGLFVTQPGSGASAATAGLGDVALSRSALSFIAGFGVDAVFGTLETIIVRVFSVQAGGMGTGLSRTAPG